MLSYLTCFHGNQTKKGLERWHEEYAYISRTAWILSGPTGALGAVCWCLDLIEIKFLSVTILVTKLDSLTIFPEKSAYLFLDICIIHRDYS